MTIQTKNFNCIVCPIGCRLTVQMEGNNVAAVSGNTCPRGEQYAREEATAPRRTLTATVKIKNAPLPLLPVVSAQALPKEKILECASFLRSVEVSAPVRAGQTIVADILGLGIDITASRGMSQKTE